MSRTTASDHVALSVESPDTKQKTAHDPYHRMHDSQHCRHNGALRDGPAPQLFSIESFGLLSQYAAVGLIYGALPATVVPFLMQYLNMEGTQTTSARTLMSIPWSFKVFIGMLSDCVPICGYRRRPYMLLGWIVCCSTLLIMAFLPFPKPYFTDPTVRTVHPVNYTESQRLSINTEAPTHGGKYIVLMMTASMGYLIADVAADAVLVEYAQREPEATRGRTQTAIYTTRTFFSVVANVLIGVGMNSSAYGGSFDHFGLGFPHVMLVLGLFLIPILPITWHFVYERPVTPPVVQEYLSNLWLAIQSRALYQVLAYSFFSGIFANFTYVANDSIASIWVKCTGLEISLANICGYVVSMVTLMMTGRYGLMWNWRRMTIISVSSIILIDAICTMATVWGLVRHATYWLGLSVVENVPAYVQFIISTFVVVELAGEGNEGAIYGLMTTVNNLSDPVAKTLTKVVNANFQVSNQHLRSDTDDVRWSVTKTIWIAYGMKLMALCLLPLLPPQKAAVQALKHSGGSNRRMGMITVAYLSMALIYSMLINLFSVFESTKCLAVAGGRGCSSMPT